MSTSRPHPSPFGLMFWFQHDLGWDRAPNPKTKKGKKMDKTQISSIICYSTLYNCIKPVFLVLPTAHLAHHWRSRRSCSKIECPPSLREVPGKMEFSKHCWGANQGKIVSLKPKAWTNRKVARIHVFSCKKSQDICVQKVSSFKSLQVNIRIPVRGLSHLLAVLFGAARLPVLFFRQHASWLDAMDIQTSPGGQWSGRCNTLLKDV